MLECVVNVAEGRRARVLVELDRAGGAARLDRHADPDHHRSVFTLAGPRDDDAPAAARSLTRTAAEQLDLRSHDGRHPRFGVVDVVPFVALAPTASDTAISAARDYAEWVAAELEIPTFLYEDADPQGRSLPELRRDAFRSRRPDVGGPDPHPRLGAVAVGARPPLVAVNCWLASDDLDVARAIAREVRARDGGLAGVRALGFALASRGCTQVSMNVVDLARTSVEIACATVARRATARGVTVSRIELVGLVPDAEWARWSPEFRDWSGIGADRTLGVALARVGGAAAGGGSDPAPAA